MSDRLATYEIRLKDNFSQGFKKLDNRVDRFDNKMDKLGGPRGTGGKVGGMSQGFAMLGRAALGLGAALGVGALGGKIIKMGVDMEQTRVSFATFLGDAEKANQVIGQLNEFSNVTPFDNAQVLQAGKGLLAFGVTAEELIPSLRSIGDIAAGTGKDFNELATIYGKARVAGTLYAEDINQLVEAGVPIMGEFAKALGTTEDQVKKMASEGKLKFKDLETAFKNLTGEGGMFFNLMEKQSQTVGGRFSTLLGKLQGIGISLGEAVLPTLSKVLDFTLKIVEQIPKLDYSPIIDTFREIGRQVNEVIVVFDDLFSAFGSSSDEIFTLQNAVDVIALSFRIATTPLRMLIEGVLLLRDVAGNVIDVFSGLGDVIAGVFTFDNDLIAKGTEKFGKAIDEGFSKIKNRVTAFNQKEGKFVLSLFRDREEEKQKESIQGSSAAGAGSLGAAGVSTGGAKTGRESTASSISGSSPKNITLNINKLIEQVIFKQNFEQNKQGMVEEIKRALLTSLNDVIIAQQ